MFNSNHLIVTKKSVWRYVGSLHEIRKLNDSFSKLEADMQLMKNVNDLLSQRVFDLEK